MRRSSTLALAATGLLAFAVSPVSSVAGSSASPLPSSGSLAGVPTQGQIDAVTLPAVDDLIAEQSPLGIFEDPVRGPIGQGGLTRAVWVALKQSSRLTGEPAEARLHLARRSLSRGIEGTQLLPKWPIALLVEEGLQNQLRDPGGLIEDVQGFGRLDASGVADGCYQDTNGCFNNYRLTSEVLDLELARSGLHSSVPGARLTNPRLRQHSLEWLGRDLPATTSETAVVRVPEPSSSSSSSSPAGVVRRHVAAALSDPNDYPLAYQAFCTAMLARAAVLGGAEFPKAALSLEHAALWDLVGMAAPDGEISWLGRGQDEVWTLAAALYAGVQGSILMAHLDPDLAARLRRLAGIEMAALQARLGPQGLRPKPNLDTSPAGMDAYASAIGNESLALVWLELAREVSPAAGGPSLPLPSEQSGGSAVDPHVAGADSHGAGLFTLRRGNVWIGVHTVQKGGDPRLGFGLLRALAQRPGGGWSSLLPERPISPGAGEDPAPGPTLVRGGSTSAPLVESGVVGAARAQSTTARGAATMASAVDEDRPAAAAIALSGSWSGAAGSVSARWTWTPERDRVRLQTPCPAGADLRFTEWLPEVGPLVRARSGVSRDGFRVDFSEPIRLAALAGRYGSAREPALQAYRVSLVCHGAPVEVTWSGSESATG